jgi:hypothetical protein
MRRWLRVRRRMLCARLGHPQADWSPIVLTYEDMTFRAWRCARHDRP